MGASYLLINGYYDFPLSRSFQPYLGLGVGFGRVNVDGNLFGSPAEDDDSVFVYQLGTGVGWTVLNSLTLTVNYRYLGTSDPEFAVAANRIEGEFYSHQFTLGVRYLFE